MKLVKESISFQRGVDPKNILGIGKRHLIEEWIKKWKDEAKTKSYTINSDLSIDVDSFHIFAVEMGNFPEYIQFNRSENHFSIQRAGITTLRGCPVWVGGIFSYSENLLTSLEFCPKYIENTFYCYDNKVKFTQCNIPKGCIIKGDIAY